MKKIAAAALIAVSVFGAGAAHAAADTTPPTVGFTTADGSIRVGAPIDTDLTTVTGTTRDTGSGVRSVDVTFCTGYKLSGGGWVCNVAPVGRIRTVRATLSCSGASCSWRAIVPVEPGGYLVFAEAKDKAGNRRSTGPIEITVI